MFSHVKQAEDWYGKGRAQVVDMMLEHTSFLTMKVYMKN